MEESKVIVFFDLDDTILNTNEFHETAISKGFENLEININEPIKKYLKMYKQYMYQNSTFLYSKVFENEENQDKNHKKLAKKAGNQYENYENNNQIDHINNEFDLCVKKLKENNINVGIISQGKDHIQNEKVERLKLKEHIDHKKIFVYENKNAKAFKEVLDKFKETKCYYVGDREDTDVIEARSAGFKVVRFNNPKGRRYNVSTLNDYPQYESLLECITHIVDEVNN